MRVNILNNACCFTGHRFIKNAEKERIRKQISNQVTALYDGGYRQFYTGGAIGFDTIAAFTVLEVRKNMTDIKLSLILPCPDQDKLWRDADRSRYQIIFGEADSFEYVSCEYTPHVMLKRNQLLVEKSSSCICYLNNQKSGTSYTVKYALEKNLDVFNIYSGSYIQNI